jgi:hypothetical protein
MACSPPPPWDSLFPGFFIFTDVFAGQTSRLNWLRNAGATFRRFPTQEKAPGEPKLLGLDGSGTFTFEKSAHLHVRQRA